MQLPEEFYDLDEIERQMVLEELGFEGPSDTDWDARVTSPLKPKPHAGAASIALPEPD